MIVAMIAVRMVEMSIDQIVDMVAMGNRFMTAARPMDMGGVMAAAMVIGGATLRIGRRNLNRMLVDMIPMGMV